MKFLANIHFDHAIVNRASHFSLTAFTMSNMSENTTELNVVNLNEAYNAGDIAYICLSTATVLLMIPGLGFLYAGLTRRNSALCMIWICFMGACVGLGTWYVWGYSLAFSGTATNPFIGNLHNVGFRHVSAAPPVSTMLVPELVFAVYQALFSAVTITIVLGALAERGRMVPALVFSFAWITIVYCPIAYWIWNPKGWANKWGVLDYAGGGPVEIASGIGGLAYSFILGPRTKHQQLKEQPPHNIVLITAGTSLLWFGWLGFNGGSAYGANLRAVYASWNTTLTAIFCGLSWSLCDRCLKRKWSTVSICSGFISGLVAATPASGLIPQWASVILGLLTGIVCNFSTKLKGLLSIDDAMDIFAEHGVAGALGLIWNAFFAVPYVIELDGVSFGSTGGWLNQNWAALYKQLAYICACSGYVFIISTVLCLIIDRIPGLHLRSNGSKGVDEEELGEQAYNYMDSNTDFICWDTPDVSIGVSTQNRGENSIENGSSREKHA
ncbi:ammonium transporter AmtB-like domain-containing protein [Lipomyces oligophaga]|uniref:ammonium transporter AmtB-like domain-containing protein n=1 Tax=Lipomyces oligophaga TaxID=45792 RepID=UPI0034CDEC5E